MARISFFVVVRENSQNRNNFPHLKKNFIFSQKKFWGGFLDEGGGPIAQDSCHQVFGDKLLREKKKKILRKESLGKSTFFSFFDCGIDCGGKKKILGYYGGFCPIWLVGGEPQGGPRGGRYHWALFGGIGKLV